MALLAALIGLFGLFCMTWLFPTTGTLFARKRAPSLPVGGPNSISVLIPAHDEERSIAKTLESVFAAIAEAKLANPALTAEVLVGADGCSDATARIARERGATVLEFSPGQGKWKTLNALLAAAPTAAPTNASGAAHDREWIVFADAGAIWERELLAKCLLEARDPTVIGVAPTYRNPAAGALEAVAWSLESSLKRLEDRAGGPVSVHGATVLYRRAELVDCLRELAGRAWLNDDVVIPLALRMRNPGARIRYLADASVRDFDPGEAQGAAVPREFATRELRSREFVRRSRMVRGNAEWIRSILLPAWRSNPTVALLALRRVFRLFWAYWGLALGLAALAVLAREPRILACALALAAAFAYKFRRPLVALADAAVASFLAPWFLSGAGSGGGWK